MANLNVASRYTLDDNSNSDKTWKDLTLAANSSWKEGDDYVACNIYNLALKEAERLMDLAEHGLGPAEAPVIMVISHHNLAEVALRIGQPDVTLAHYQKPFDRLLVLASLESTPEDLRQTCVANLKEAANALVIHLKSIGAHVWHVNDIIKKAQFAVAAASRSAVCVRLS